MTKPETSLQYVIRALNNPAYNNAEAARETGLTTTQISNLALGKAKNPLHSTVQKLHDYFKNLGAK